MPIYPRTGGFQVQVSNSKAKPTFKRIRLQCDTLQEAEDKEHEISTALDVYGKWPVEAGDRPMVSKGPALKRAKSGTLRLVAEIAKNTHWNDTPYEYTACKYVDLLVDWFEGEGVADLDAISSEDVDRFKEHCRDDRENGAKTINAKLSALSVIFKIAQNRKPKLMHHDLKLPRVRPQVTLKWWMKPEDMVKAADYLTAQNDTLFLHYIQFLLLTGLRVKEALNVRLRDFRGLDTEKAFLRVPGTKNESSEATIAITEEARQIVLKRDAENKARGQTSDRLFDVNYTHMQRRWTVLREFLGYGDVKTATLRALRRSFAHLGVTKYKMDALTLRSVMRHSSVNTTQGYLRLTGAEEGQNGANYLHEIQPSAKPAESGGSIDAAIKAYSLTGASPEEVARFTKALLTQ